MQQLPLGAYVMPDELVRDRQQKSKIQLEKIQIVYIVSIFILLMKTWSSGPGQR
jgi:hypothetical protein